MNNPFGWLWRVYVELLKFVGNAVLVVAGIALCAYATVEQYEPVHSTQTDTMIFAVGIALVISSWVRRVVWTCLGLGVPWLLLVGGALYLFVEDKAHFDVTGPIVVLVAAPPVLAAFVLEILSGPTSIEGREPGRPPSEQGVD